MARAQPRGVAVQRDHRLVMQAPHQAQLIFGHGRAQWGDRPLEPGADQGDHIHIPFGDDQRGVLAHRRAGGADIEQRAPLVEQRRFGRIQVFRARVEGHCPPAEGDAAVPGIADRKQDAAAEPVIGLAAVIRPGA